MSVAGRSAVTGGGSVARGPPTGRRFDRVPSRTLVSRDGQWWGGGGRRRRSGSAHDRVREVRRLRLGSADFVKNRERNVTRVEDSLLM